MMSRVSWGMLFFLVTIILTGCSSDDDFSGRTFTIVDNSTLLETKEQMNMQEEDTRRVLLSLTFDSGEVTINSNQNLTGEYETFDDRLEITLSDDKGDVTLVFSDLASSVEKNVKYTAEI